MTPRRLLGALGLLAVIGCTSSAPSLGSARVTPPPAETQAAAAARAAFPTPVITGKAKVFDQQFIDTLVPHLQLETELAQIALTRAQHEELRALAQEVIDDNTDLVRDMQEWRADWFGSRLTPPMGGAAEIAALRSAPEPFDVAFIDALLPLQQPALDLANRAVLEAGQQDILDAAGDVLASHSRYALQMQSWRQTWAP